MNAKNFDLVFGPMLINTKKTFTALVREMVKGIGALLIRLQLWQAFSKSSES